MDILTQIVRLLTPAQRATIRPGDSAGEQEKALVVWAMLQGGGETWKQ